jgi:hypothetical protein
MERQKFEDSLKNVFGQAEVNPTENVWNNIELDLVRAESKQMRRRLLFYKMVAAASVIFALSAVGMNMYLLKGNWSAAGSNLSASPPEKLSNEANSTPVVSERSQALVPDRGTTPPHEKATQKHDHGRQADSDYQGGVDQEKAIAVRNDETGEGSNPIFYDDAGILKVTPLRENALAYLPQPAKISFGVANGQTEKDPVEMMLAKLQQREFEIRNEEKMKEKKSKEKENLWTSLGFAAGPFNSLTTSSLPTARTATAETFMAKSAIAGQEAKASGIAYSMGLNVGTKISARWLLQGGVNYLMQSSDYTAESAVGNADFENFRPASINELGKLSNASAFADTRFVTTAPYNVNNNVTYLSIPVQAGYVILNKKLGLQINAGISTDLFIKNRKTTDGANLEDIDQGRGEDSPYRPLNVSGLVGTELTYRFAQRYRIALNPGIRYPLNSIYKSDLGIQSSPVIFDVGLRFRYIFH